MPNYLLCTPLHLDVKNINVIVGYICIYIYKLQDIGFQFTLDFYFSHVVSLLSYGRNTT